jgi:hypothetical protein
MTHDLLSDYPPFCWPSVGFGGRLTEDQARANFDHFRLVVSDRLELISQLLADQAGVDAAPALTAPARLGADLAGAVNRWSSEVWPKLRPPGSGATTDGWITNPVQPVASVLTDVSILLGELVSRGNPTWRWGIDLDQGNLADDMLSSRRVVLVADPVGAMPYPFLIDVEAVVVARFLRPDDPSHRLLDPFRRLVEEGIAGTAFEFWRETDR